MELHTDEKEGYMSTETKMKDTMMAQDKAYELFNVMLPDIPTSQVLGDVIDKANDLVIKENIFKTLELLGLKLIVKGRYEGAVVKDIKVAKNFKKDFNLVEVADANSDIVVVSKGTQASYGIDDVDGDNALPDMVMIQKYMDVVCSQPIRNIPGSETPLADIGDKDRRLRGSLIVEESLELLMLGFGQTLKLGTDHGNIILDKSEIKNFDVVIDEVGKEVDLHALKGHLIAINIRSKAIDAVFGIPSDHVILDEVMRANLDKIWDDGKAHFREDGKNIKPPNHQPPNIARVLKEHGWDGSN